MKLRNVFRNVEAKIRAKTEDGSYSITNITKYRSFQFRLLHRAIITNVHLCKWGKVDDANGSFCKKEKETYSHLFLHCESIKPIWNKVDQWMKQWNDTIITLSVDKVILNCIVEDARSVKNFICLMLKQYIYRQRCLQKAPTYQEFISITEKVRNVEKYIAIKNNKLSKHCMKWNCDDVAEAQQFEEL